MTIERKTALVTGAGQNVGQGIAHRLAAQGIHVLVNDIDAAKAESAAAEIRASGQHATAAAFDVTDTPTVLQQLAELEVEYGGIDILVNNAGNAGTQATNQAVARSNRARRAIFFKDLRIRMSCLLRKT